MGLMTVIKANKAYRLQQKGQKEEAVRLYEECFAEGLNEPRFNLAYALLIIREGEYRKAKDFLVKTQKAPGMTQEQRTTMLVDYAACCFRLGDVDKAVTTLEQQFRKVQNGLLYQTLGYLYVEKYDLARRAEFEAALAETAAKEAAEAESSAPAPEQAEDAGAEAAEAAADSPAQAPVTPAQVWEAGADQAEAFLRESVDYDDEDPVCLDNMGQFLYRVRGRKEEARAWFEKALAQKDNQIDTLMFLSRYDAEAGNLKGALEKAEKALEGRFSPLNYWTKENVKQEIERLKGENKA